MLLLVNNFKLDNLRFLKRRKRKKPVKSSDNFLRKRRRILSNNRVKG